MGVLFAHRTLLCIWNEAHLCMWVAVPAVGAAVGFPPLWLRDLSAYETPGFVSESTQLQGTFSICAASQNTFEKYLIPTLFFFYLFSFVFYLELLKYHARSTVSEGTNTLSLHCSIPQATYVLAYCSPSFCVVYIGFKVRLHICQHPKMSKTETELQVRFLPPYANNEGVSSN